MLLKTFQLFSTFLEYFGLFWNILEYFAIIWEYFGIFWNILEYFGSGRSPLGGIFWNILAFLARNLPPWRNILDYFGSGLPPRMEYFGIFWRPCFKSKQFLALTGVKSATIGAENRSIRMSAKPRTQPWPPEGPKWPFGARKWPKTKVAKKCQIHSDPISHDPV